MRNAATSKVTGGVRRRAGVVRQRPGGNRWWIWVSCCLALAVVALVWIGMRADDPAENVQEPAQPKATKANRRADAVRVRPTESRSRPSSRVTEVEKPVKSMEAEVPGEAVETNAPPEEAPARKEPLFRHGAEQLLALATPAEPGMSVPPLPKITDETVAEDLARAMKDTIRPTTNDTERTLEVKLNVAQQKEEFRDLQAGGMTFVEYVNALRDKFNEDAAYLAEARKLDESLFNDKDISDKDYKAYREELNKSLRERGLPELEAR